MRTLLKFLLIRPAILFVAFLQQPLPWQGTRANETLVIYRKFSVQVAQNVFELLKLIRESVTNASDFAVVMSWTKYTYTFNICSQTGKNPNEAASVEQRRAQSRALEKVVHLKRAGEVMRRVPG